MYLLVMLMPAGAWLFLCGCRGCCWWQQGSRPLCACVQVEGRTDTREGVQAATEQLGKLFALQHVGLLWMTCRIVACLLHEHEARMLQYEGTHCLAAALYAFSHLLHS